MYPDFPRPEHDFSGGEASPFSSFCVLALKRTDSSSDSNRRKDSTVSKVSDHEAKVEVRAEDMDGGGGGERATSAASAVPESPLFDVPGEEDELEESMPWLKVVARVANGFNFCCTHQGFCHPSCFRRQMRASRRIMVAARRVSDTTLLTLCRRAVLEGRRVKHTHMYRNIHILAVLV